MLKIPQSLNASFHTFLSKRNVPKISHNDYKKWLRYYLDYCYKYRFNPLNPAGLPHFLNKLKEKKQTGLQQKQAHESIRLFYELVNQQNDIKRVLASINHQNIGIRDKGSSLRPGIRPNDHLQKMNLSDYNRNLTVKKGQFNYNWQKIYAELNNEIKVRHYSPKTLKSYMIWVRKFQNYTKSKNPETLSTSDVKAFLTFLVVEQKGNAWVRLLY